MRLRSSLNISLISRSAATMWSSSCMHRRCRRRACLLWPTTAFPMRRITMPAARDTTPIISRVLGSERSRIVSPLSNIMYLTRRILPWKSWSKLWSMILKDMTWSTVWFMIRLRSTATTTTMRMISCRMYLSCTEALSRGVRIWRAANTGWICFRLHAMYISATWSLLHRTEGRRISRYLRVFPRRNPRIPTDLRR